MAKTSIGMEQNFAGVLCYVLGWISGLYFILKEKENKFVRFHAMQSIVVFGAITVAFIVIRILMLIPPLNLILLMITLLLCLFSVVLWVILMSYAYQERRYKLPWAGNFAEKKIS
jgi:uncharacterized membrane protein